MLLNYKDYLTKWDEIAAIFSRDAVLKGSFDQYAEGLKGKRGTTEVDDAFLQEIEHWRDLLARIIALRNPDLQVRELNYAVQMTIDRIVFLRICEDRGIERENQLQELLEGEQVYERLCQVFRQADNRYNSGLFHFSEEKGQSSKADDLTLRLAIDDSVLKEIISGLYYPSPYVFREIPADILGQVYERFLGKVIRLTAGHQAKVEEKPEVRKAGGVYYTPTYIVDYIVKNTVGLLLEGRTPGEVAGLKILDPACGSGSFLLGAYQYLLDWHMAWYSGHVPETWAKGKAPAIYQAQGGDSLIGPDYFEGHMFVDEEERYRVNAFNWQAAFPQVFDPHWPTVTSPKSDEPQSDLGEAGRGFDAVIGNPPYIRMEEFKELKSYFKANYSCHDERSDIYAYFIERTHKILNHGGRFGMIVSNKFLRANYGKPLRDFLYKNASLEHIVDLAGLPVFKGATVRTIVLLTSRKEQIKNLLYTPPLPIEIFENVESQSLDIEKAIADTTYQVPGSVLVKVAWSFVNENTSLILSKIQKGSITLEEYCCGKIGYGIKSGLDKAFVIGEKEKNEIIQKDKVSAEIIKPYLNGRDVRRYHIDFKQLYLIYTHHGIDIKQYPIVQEYLKTYKAQLQQRATKQEWYELQQPQFNYSVFFDGPKIVLPDIATEPRFAYDEMGYYGATTIFFIPLKDLYLLGLLNSKLGFAYFKETCAALEGKNEVYYRQDFRSMAEIAKITAICGTRCYYLSVYGVSKQAKRKS